MSTRCCSSAVCCYMDRRRSSGARYRDHRWQVRARVGRAEADDGHGERELHLKWREHQADWHRAAELGCQHSAPLQK